MTETDLKLHKHTKRMEMTMKKHLLLLAASVTLLPISLTAMADESVITVYNCKDSADYVVAGAYRAGHTQIESTATVYPNQDYTVECAAKECDIEFKSHGQKAITEGLYNGDTIYVHVKDSHKIHASKTEDKVCGKEGQS